MYLYFDALLEPFGRGSVSRAVKQKEPKVHLTRDSLEREEDERTGGGAVVISYSGTRRTMYDDNQSEFSRPCTDVACTVRTFQFGD